MGLMYLNSGKVRIKIKEFTIKLQTAGGIYKEIITCFPEYLDALNNYGVVNMTDDKDDQAAVKPQNVVMKNRQHVDALNNYGVILLRKGQPSLYSYAVSIFEDCIGLDKTKFVYYIELLTHV